jgi:hypothetical protein
MCGAVRIEIDEPLEHAPEACHCVNCRKQSGNFLVAVNVRRTSMQIIGDDSVAYYQSSENVQRGFCRVCGATLFWKPTMEGYQWTAVTLGSLDTTMEMKVVKHTFVAEKGSYYEITDGAPQKEAF